MRFGFASGDVYSISGVDVVLGHFQRIAVGHPRPPWAFIVFFAGTRHLKSGTNTCHYTRGKLSVRANKWPKTRNRRDN